MAVIRATTSFIASLSRSIWEAVVKNPDVQRLLKRHPKTFKVVKGRLSPSQFSALPLTALAVIFIYILLLLFGVVRDVISSEFIVAADTRMANLLYAYRDVQAVHFFWIVTILGKFSFAAPLVALIAIMFWLGRKKVFVGPLLLTFLGTELIVVVTKYLFQRPRPTGPIPVYLEPSFSFPSSHAAVAVALYGFLTYIMIRIYKRWPLKIFYFLGGLIVILLIGFSRLYLGVHFLSDVWSGYLIGALWLIIGITISEWIIYEKDIKFRAKSRRHTLKLMILIVALVPFFLFADIISSARPILNLSKTYNDSFDSVQSATDLPAIFGGPTLPKFTETLGGNPQEPLSFIILAPSDEAFVDAFSRAGWYQADAITPRTTYRTATMALKNKEYTTAPMTPSFWHYRVNDFGFEKPTPKQSVRSRHHARFWRTNLKTSSGDVVYIGTASLDTGIKWLVTHRIDPAIDIERDFLYKDLLSTGLVTSNNQSQFVPPTLGRNFSGDQYFTDGKTYVMEVK